MEQQLDFMGRDKRDIDMQLAQIKMPTELKRDIFLWCRQKGLTFSSYIRMVCIKTLEDHRCIPDPRQLPPIENAVREVKEYVPVIVRYQNPNRY